MTLNQHSHRYSKLPYLMIYERQVFVSMEGADLLLAGEKMIAACIR